MNDLLKKGQMLVIAEDVQETDNINVIVMSGVSRKTQELALSGTPVCMNVSKVDMQAPIRVILYRGPRVVMDESDWGLADYAGKKTIENLPMPELADLQKFDDPTVEANEFWLVVISEIVGRKCKRTLKITLFQG